MAAASAAARSVEFDAGFLMSGGGRTERSAPDLTRFSHGNAVVPGRYDADLKVNGVWKGRHALSFVPVEGEDSAQPCMDRQLLMRIGVELQRLDNDARAGGEAAPVPMHAEGFCGDPGQAIPGAVLAVADGGLAVDLTVPQIYVTRDSRDNVSPELWDAGATAAAIGYRFSASNSNGQAGPSRSDLHLGLNAGFNAGAWQLHHQGSLSQTRDRGREYQAQRTFISRDLTALHSTLQAGDTFTSGQHFDAVPLRGITLETQDQMLPASRTGYAPVVRGTAETNARVTIHQSGFLIRETTVAPGPFEIDDLASTAGAGDLTVTVHESDGRQRRFAVPYGSSPQLVRAGYTRYAASAGRTRMLRANPQSLLQAGAHHGVSDALTVYGASALMQRYQAHQIGAALNTPFGAMSLDLSRSRAGSVGPEAVKGQSVQVRYNRNFPASGSNIALGAHRYSTSGYIGIQDAIRMGELRKQGLDPERHDRIRSRLELHLSQSLGAGRGTVNLAGTASTYWGTRNSRREYTLGYGNSWRGAGININASRTRDLNFGDDEVMDYSMTVSLPLGSSRRRASAHLGTRFDGHSGARSHSAGISGTATDALVYGASASTTNGWHSDRRMNANISYAAGAADLTASYSQGRNYRSAFAGAHGLIVVHRGGMTAGRGSLPGTVAIVHAPGAAGARVQGGGRVNSAGYAVQAGLTPYRLNDIALDPKGASEDLQMDASNQVVAPRMGAISLLTYKTARVPTLMFVARDPAGRALPFGAQVYNDAGDAVGVVTQASRVVVQAVNGAPGALTVGLRDGQRCRIVEVPAAAAAAVATATCVRASTGVQDHVRGGVW